MLLSDLTSLAILSIVYLAIFGLTELFYLRFKPNAEYTRKFIHVVCGLITMSFPKVFQSHFSVLIIVSSFTAILYFSKKYHFLQSIHAIPRESKGSIVFPIVIYLCFLAQNLRNDPLYFYLPLLIMFVCDPVAALIGTKFGYVKFYNGSDHKTLSGSVAFLIVAVLISVLFLDNFRDYTFIKILFIAIGLGLTTAITEALSRNGTDNLFIPIAAVVYMYFVL